MIDFRYHIVSLIAVFLALGIGVVVGTTVVDRGVVTRLEAQVNGLNEEVKSERQDRLDARAELSVWDKFATEGSKFFVGGRLDRRTVTVVFPQGVDEAEVDAVATTMRQAGASVPATFQLTDKLNLRDQTARDQLALATGAASTDPAVLYQALTANLGVKLGGAPATDPAVRPEVQATLLGRLEESGFLRVKRLDATTGDVNAMPTPTPSSTVYGADADQISIPYDTVLLPLARAMAPGGRTVAVQRSGEDQEFMRDLRTDEAVAAKMSTVDDIQNPIGKYAAVLALEQAPDGVFGAYGTGAGAESLLPERVTR
ncbi:MAG: copper transporter [Acidimicrobiia bacterium]